MVSVRPDVVVQETEPVAEPSRADRYANLGRGRLGDATGFYRRSWQRYRRNRVAVVALVVFLLVILFVLAAGLISRALGHGFEEPDLPNKLAAPMEHGYILGTDALGRDLLVRLAYGGRVSLLVAGLAGITTLLIGGFVGATSGYFGGIIDAVLMRIVDILLTLPGLSILILIFSLYAPPPVVIALILAAFGWAGVARIIRSEVLSLRTREHVAAARVIGASNGRIILRHILPNVLPTMLVWASLAIPGLILTEAALSFLGFGVRVPTPSWGNMLQGAEDYYVLSWTNAFVPGLMIYLTVLCTNLIGDGLRDAFDPRLNQ